MSLVLIYFSPAWGCVCSDGRTNSFRDGILGIAGDGAEHAIRIGEIGILAGTGFALSEGQCRWLNQLGCDFTSAAMQIRELLHDYPPADEPEYREMLRQGFQKPAAVFLGRDDGKLRCENILGESAIFKAGAASLFAIGNSELVADELRELVSRIASIGRATVPLLLRDVILVASQRDFVRVSPSVLVREISAQQQDESPWVSGFERVVYFLSLPGFSCRKIPPKMKPFLTYLENICVGNTGYHFGRIIIEPNADIESALEAFQRAGVIALPPHRSATPVQAEVIRTLQDLAPDIGARLGDMTHDILARAYAARGFAPIAPPK